MLITGYNKLEAELKQLKTVDRPSIILAIEEARAHGDLKENAEYHSAKDQQGMTEARIKDIEGKLGHSEVIDPKTLSGDKIKFGATITLTDEEAKSVVYQIVGLEEADVKKSRISYSSPLARALINKSVGEEIEVKTPSGEKYYEVVEIKFI